MELKRLGALLLLTASCTAGPGADPGDLGGNKGDSLLGSYANELKVEGARTTTVKLDTAFQCEITQWGIMLGWHNRDINQFDFPTFRATIWSTGVAAGQKLKLTDSNHRFIFDGFGHSSERGGSCDVDVAELFNDTHKAGIGLKFRDCAMAPSGSGGTIKISGEVSCVGAGFTPVVITNGPDAGIDAPGTTPGIDAGAPDAGPPVDPCAGRCGASQVCVNAQCVSRSSQMQDFSCNAPSASCDAGEDGDCADGNVCVAGKCRRLSCQAQDFSCNQATTPCDGDDSSDCAAGNVCAAGMCRRLSCQVQDFACNQATRPCDGEDSDCGEGNVCAAGMCRRLSCQAQDFSCNQATAPCDGEDSDCASGNVCRDSVCKRSTCLR